MVGKRFVVTFKFTGSDKEYYLNGGTVSFCDDIYEAKFMTADTAHDTVHHMSNDTEPNWVTYLTTTGLSIREGQKSYKRCPITQQNIVYGFTVKQVTFS